MDKRRTAAGAGSLTASAGRRAAASRGRPRDPAADTAILQAAWELLAEHGVDGTSIEGIARRAGVARLTVYRRWSSKEALLADAIEAARQLPGPTPDASQAAPAEQVLDRLVEVLSAEANRPESLRLLARLIGSRYSHPTLLSAYWDTWVLPRRHLLAQVIERAKAQGLFPEHTDTEVLIDIIGGALAYHLLVRPEQRSVEQTRTFLRTVLRQAGYTPKASSGK